MKNLFKLLPFLLLVTFIGCEMVSDNPSAQQNRITYHPNGAETGTPPIDNTLYNSGQNVVLADYGTLDKSGYKFLGWSPTSTGSFGYVRVADTITMTSEDLVLYAIWTAEPTFNIIYTYNNADSGTVIDNNNYLQGSTATAFSEGTLSKIHHSLLSWTTNEDGSGNSYTPGASIPISNSNIILYAQWSEDPKYSVIYNGNSSTAGSVPTDNLTYFQGEEATVLSNSEGLDKLYNNFVCWNSRADGTGQDYYPGSTVELAAENFQLYAKWEGLPSHRIYYHSDNSDSGVVPIDSGEYYSGDSITILGHGNLSKELHGFDGWNSMENGNGLNYKSGSTIVMGNSDIHLYSEWVVGEELFDVGSFEIKMLYSAGGTFGSGVHNDNDYLQTGSPLADPAVSPFWIAETELTYKQWNTVYTWAVNNGYHFQNSGRQGGDTNLSSSTNVGDDNHPVTRINWRDAIVFCNAITEYYNSINGVSFSCVYEYNGSPIRDSRTANAAQLDSLVENSSADGFRLPHNMEWECAARYNTNGSWTDGRTLSGASGNWLDKAASLEVAVFSQYADSTTTGVNSTAYVKSKLVNDLGCYDMSGNVMEWCFDKSPITPDDGNGGYNRVARGGSWRDNTNACVVGYYDAYVSWAEFTSSIYPTSGDGATESFIGLRLARTP